MQFCMDELARDLKAKGKKMDTHIITMTDEKMVSSQVIKNLEIMDLQGQNNIQPQEVYSQEQIHVSVSKDDIPR